MKSWSCSSCPHLNRFMRYVGQHRREFNALYMLRVLKAWSTQTEGVGGSQSFSFLFLRKQTKKKKKRKKNSKFDRTQRLVWSHP